MSKTKKPKSVRGREFFGEAPMWRLVLIMALPSAIMMFSIGSYFFFDNVLSINLAGDSYTDSEGQVLTDYFVPGVAPASLVRIFMSGYAPINALLMAVTLLMGVGISTRVAINLGRGDVERAKNTLRTGFMVGLIAAFVITPVLILVAKAWIVQQYSAFDSRSIEIIKNEAFRYALPIIATYPIYMFGNMSSSLFRVEARNKEMLTVMIVPIFLNLFLDWVMMGPANLGVEGGAWATVSANAFMALLVFFFIWRSSPKSLLHFSILFGFKFHIIAIFGILLVGLAPFLRNMAQSITSSVQNNLMNQVSSQVFFDNYFDSWQALSPERQQVHIRQALELLSKDENNPLWNDLTSIFGTSDLTTMTSSIQQNLTAENWDIFVNDQTFIDDTLAIFNSGDMSGASQIQATYIMFMTPVGIIHQQSASAMISIMSASMPIYILFFPIMYSFAQSSRPIAAYNYGMKNYKRVKQAYYWTIIYATAAALFLYFIVAFGISGPLIDLLQVENSELLNAKSQAQDALKIAMLTMVFFSLAIGGMVLFGSTDRIILSTISSALQGLIIFWPVIYGFKAAAIANPTNDLLFIWFLPITAGIASIVVSVLVIHTLLTLHKKDQHTLDERIEKIYEWRDRIVAKRKERKKEKIFKQKDYDSP